MHRHAGQDLSCDQPREFAHVLSTIKLLEKKQQRISDRGQSLRGNLFWYVSSIIFLLSRNNIIEIVIEKVLLPVLEVIEDHETSNMILRIMCEAWLDYIYLHRIKFR